MTSKRINELVEKNPAATDLIPVADPITGIAGKSNILQIRTGEDESVKSRVAFTPTLLNPLVEGFFCSADLSLPFQREQIENALTLNFLQKSSSGCTYNITPNQSGGDFLKTTQITISDEIGVNTAFIGNWNNLVTFSAPNTENAFINFNSCYRLQNINIPNAKNINLNVNNSCRFLTSLVFPNANYFSINTNFISGLLNSISCENAERGGSISVRGSSNTYGYPNLTIFNFPKLKYAINIELSGAPQITNFSFPELLLCSGIYPNPGYVQTINVPKLVNCYNGQLVGASCPNLTTINAPSLVRSQVAPINNGQASPATLPLLTSINLPVFDHWGIMTPTFNNNDLTASPTYTMDGYWQFGITGASALTTINLPLLKAAGGNSNVSFNITNCPSLSSFTVNQTPVYYQGNFICTGAALNQASVDGILAACAYMNGTANAPYPSYSNKTINLSGGTSSAPSVAGLASKAILVARGCTVTHN